MGCYGHRDEGAGHALGCPCALCDVKPEWEGDVAMLPYHIKGFTFITMNAQDAVPSVVVSCIYIYFKTVMKQAGNYLEFLNHSWITAEIKYGRTLSAWSDAISLCTAGTAFSFCSQVSEVRECLPLCLVSINSPWKKLSSNRFFPQHVFLRLILYISQSRADTAFEWTCCYLLSLSPFSSW